jgi:hypothetical protein
LNGLGSAAGAATDFISTVARGIKDLINNDIIDPIRGIHISWKGFHGIGKFDIHPFGFLPRLHSGGVFRAPTAGGEGLALLKDRETVLPPGVSPQSGGSFIFNNFAPLSPRTIDDARRRWLKRNGAFAA